MQLPNDFSEKEAVTGGNKFPEAKGYTFRINAVYQKEFFQKQCMFFDVDISQGEHKGFFAKSEKRKFALSKIQDLSTSEKFGDGYAKLKGIFQTIIGQNLSMFPEVVQVPIVKDEQPAMAYNYDALYASGDFDEQRLVNLESGGVLNYNKAGFLNFSYFCGPKTAEAVEALPQPPRAPKAPKTQAGFGGGQAPVQPQMPIDEDLPF
jgi:hypothetical protein